jgi:hypothetical protein
MDFKELQNTIFDVEVSVFKNCFSTESVTVSLAQWLTSNKYESEQNQLRFIANKKERDKVKIQLPAISPSALLKHRKKDSSDLEKLIKYSGFMQIDIDFKDNSHLSDYGSLLTKLPLIQNIAYCGLSVSGTGYFGLVCITQPDKLAMHFHKFRELIKGNFNIILDESKGARITDLRTYSYTPNAYFNVNAIPFSQLYQPKAERVKKSNSYSSSDADLFTLVLERHNLNHRYEEGNRNNYLVKLAGYCNAKGIEIGDAFRGCCQFIDEEFTEKRIRMIVDWVYSTHKESHNSHPFNAKIA